MDSLGRFLGDSRQILQSIRLLPNNYARLHFIIQVIAEIEIVPLGRAAMLLRPCLLRSELVSRSACSNNSSSSSEPSSEPLQTRKSDSVRPLSRRYSLYSQHRSSSNLRTS
jgi:hypothetical protein